MRAYFEQMNELGRPLKKRELSRSEENLALIQQVEEQLAAAVERVRAAGLPAEKVNERGQLTAWQRIDYLVDEGSWCPLHTLYDPQGNDEGTTGVIDGLARVGGRWAVVIASDNKVLAGAWIQGQAENILRVTDLAKRLRVPLVWILNCSGVKLTEQEEVYPDRRGDGTPFYRHAQLNQLGIPVLVGIYGTNPAGGGYHGISPTVLFAHKDCNIAVGGAGIVGGMSPKGGFDLEGAGQIIEAQQRLRAKPPGRVETHHGRDRLLPLRLRHRGGRARRHPRVHEGHARLRPGVLPGRRARASRASRPRRSPGSSPRNRSRPTRSSRCWPGSSMGPSTWSSGPTTDPRSTAVWPGSTAS